MANEYDIDKIFEEMESYLLSSMHRNLGRHLNEEAKEGFNWEQWQALQLESLNKYSKEHSSFMSKKSAKARRMMDDLLHATNADARTKQEAQILQAIKRGFKVNRPSKAIQESFFKLNDRKLHALVQSVDHDLSNASVAMLRRANDEYRKIIYKSEIFAATGTMTPKQAIDQASREFLSKGINCIQYRDGRMVNIRSYASMAIRTANKRAMLIGEGLKRDEWGVHTVRVSSYGACSPTCLPWQGRVYVDDVYTVSGPTEEEKKYPRLSEAIAGHLFHPNCKHTMSAYFPGVSSSSKLIDYKNTKEGSRELALQRYNQRQIERYSRLSDFSLDDGNKSRYDRKRLEWENKRKELLVDDEWMPFKIPKPLVNTETTIDRMYNSLNIGDSSLEFTDFVKRNLKSIPEQDIEFLKEFNIGILQSQEGSYFMDGNIYLDIKHPEYVLAHEMGHAAEDTILKDSEELKRLKQDIFRSSEISVRPYKNGKYYVLKNKRFVRNYQGRTYIEYLESDTYEYVLNNVTSDSLEEYMSVGYETYVKDPKLLQNKDEKLYNFFKRRGLKWEKKEKVL